ncbi:uncharacterized protein LOC115883217 [Sitophilus oryzae]|uniref:Uncharacterized protein LOC115883217 n=1 Tax=Sitophilus oryzae TaxID=7048 RepID=A0A6J2Y380_SITOR|nr:uncharacterized protein LOC115883217 [Sitophilus oryzae]
MANDKDDLEYMTRKLQEEYQRWSLEINTGKTKYLPIGVIFDRTAKDDKDIKKRISQARRTIGCLNGVFWSNEAGKKRKINIYQTLVKSSLLYGAETWRITEANRKKLEAVEMDAYRRTLGISRRDRVRNEEIQERIGIEGSLATDIERQQLMWYGDVQRMDDTRLPKQIMQWIPQHRRKRGRSKKTWKEGVTRAMSARNLSEGQWNDRKTWKLGIGQRRKTF